MENRIIALVAEHLLNEQFRSKKQMANALGLQYRTLLNACSGKCSSRCYEKVLNAMVLNLFGTVPFHTNTQCTIWIVATNRTDFSSIESLVICTDSIFYASCMNNLLAVNYHCNMGDAVIPTCV